MAPTRASSSSRFQPHLPRDRPSRWKNQIVRFHPDLIQAKAPWSFRTTMASDVDTMTAYILLMVRSTTTQASWNKVRNDRPARRSSFAEDLQSRKTRDISQASSREGLAPSPTCLTGQGGPRQGCGRSNAFCIPGNQAVRLN